MNSYFAALARISYRSWHFDPSEKKSEKIHSVSNCWIHCGSVFQKS